MSFTELAKPAGMGAKPTTPHELLYDAYIHRRIHLGMKPPINSRQSPVHNFWENVFPYALIGVPVGAFVVPRWIMTKVRRRAVAHAFASEEGWDGLWRVGGMSMRLAEDIDVTLDSPEGDWRAFALQYLREPPKV